MADQKLTVDLEANAEPLIDALGSISQNAESAAQSLEGMEEAGTQAATGMENASAGMDETIGALNDIADSSTDTADKLGDIKDASRMAADGIDTLNGKADAANGRLDSIKDSSSKAADGIDNLKEKADKADKKLYDIKDSSKKAADGIKYLKEKADGTNGKLDEIKDSSKKAADGIEEIGKSSKTTAETVTKASQKVVDALAEIEKNTKKDVFAKLGKTYDGLKSIADVAKKLSEPIKKVIGDLQEIGEAARNLGTGAEYFQKLKQASEESGEKFENVQDVFAKINETASKAFHGDADAAKKLADIGISVDDLRGKNPQEIFETVAGSLAAAGDEAIFSEEAMAVCGDRITEIGDNLDSLANADVNISSDDIIPDEAVQASMELKENFSKLWQQILVLIAQSGLIEWLGKATEIVSGIVDSFREISEAKRLAESGKVRDLGKEHNQKLDKTWKGVAKDVIDANLLFKVPKLFGKRSLGEWVTGYKKEGVDLYAGPPTQEEIAEARQKVKAQREKKEETKVQAGKTLDAIQESQTAKKESASGGQEAERQRQREEEQRERQHQREERQRRAAGALFPAEEPLDFDSVGLVPALAPP